MADNQARVGRSGAWSALIRRARSSSGFATVGAALAVVSMSSLALVGTGVTRSGLLFGSGFAWLGSNEQNQTMLVNGATGQGTDKLNLDPGGVRLEVRMFGEHAYVVQIGKDGARVLYRLDDANLGTAVRQPIKDGQSLTRSGDRAWLVNRKAGTIDPVDPDALTPAGEGARFEGPIAEAPDGAGRLVVVEESTANVFVVSDSRSAGEPVGSPGDRLVVATVEDHPVVVNVTRSEVRVYTDGVPATVTLPAGPGTIEVAPASEGAALPILRRDGARGELLMVNVEDRSVRPVVIEGGVPQGAGAPYAVDGAVFLVDSSADTVLVIDPGTGKVRDRVRMDLPRDRQPDAFVKDGRLWVNDTSGEKAVIVEQDGRRHTVNKYDRKVPEINPATAPDSPVGAPKADDRPQPDPGPRGDRGGAGPTGAGPGPGPNGPLGDPLRPPPPAVVTAPGAPQQLTARGSNASVKLTWQTGSDGGGAIIGYTLTCRPDCGDRGNELDLPAGESYTAEGLDNGTTYQFQLRARNQAGASQPATASAQPTADVPPTPRDVRAEATGDGKVKLTWKADGGGLTLTAFTIEGKSTKSGSASFETPARVGATDYTYDIDADQLKYDDDAEPDWTFAVTAAAGAKVGDSGTSNGVDPYKAPTWPTGSRPAGTQANGQSTVSWPAATANGRVVTSYRLERCQGANCTNFANAVDAGAARSSTVTGLKNGTAYRFRVTPINAAGPGTPIVSDAVTPVGKPDITLAGADATSDDAIVATFTVSWLGDTGTCQLKQPRAATIPCGGSYTITGLNASSPYRVEVCATNSAGQSCSQVRSATTKAPPGMEITINASRWLPVAKAATICNGRDGVGVQPSPNTKTNPQRCAPEGTKETVECEVPNGIHMQSDYVQGGIRETTLWFKIAGKSEYLSALWIQKSGEPGSLGLPRC